MKAVLKSQKQNTLNVKNYNEEVLAKTVEEVTVKLQAAYPKPGGFGKQWGNPKNTQNA